MVCPYCHKEIDSVNAHGELYTRVTIYGSKGQLQYGDFDYGDVDYYGFQCPECYHELTEEEVAKLLKVSKDEVPALVKQ